MTKILLVDDESLIRYSLSSTLRRTGCEVKAVANGTDALEALRGTSYDICFLDVHLPDANGLDLMPLIQDISPATSIIIMTAVDLDDRQMKKLQEKGGRFLPKPFDLDHVRALVAASVKTPESISLPI